jgi:hypothetical protein
MEAWVLVHGLLKQRVGDSIDEAFERCVDDCVSLRLGDRVPAAYLTGLAWYFNRWFEVERGVMIPRSPIGEVIETNLRPWLREPPDRIMDLCCGTGCLGVMAALAFPEASVTLIDIDERALSSARSNVLRHGVSEASGNANAAITPRHPVPQQRSIIRSGGSLNHGRRLVSMTSPIGERGIITPRSTSNHRLKYQANPVRYAAGTRSPRRRDTQSSTHRSNASSIESPTRCLRRPCTNTQASMCALLDPWP